MGVGRVGHVSGSPLEPDLAVLKPEHEHEPCNPGKVISSRWASVVSCVKREFITAPLSMGL